MKTALWLLILLLMQAANSSTGRASDEATPSEVLAVTVKACETALVPTQEASLLVKEKDESRLRLARLRIAITEFLHENGGRIADPQITELLKDIVIHRAGGLGESYDPYKDPRTSKYEELFDSIISKSKVVERLDAMNVLEDVNEAMENDGFALTPTDVSQILVPQSTASLWSKLFRRTPKIEFKDAQQFTAALKLVPVEKRWKTLKRSLKEIPGISTVELRMIMGAFRQQELESVYSLLSSKVRGSLWMYAAKQRALLALQGEQVSFEAYEILELIEREPLLASKIIELSGSSGRRVSFDYIGDKLDAVKFDSPEKQALVNKIVGRQKGLAVTTSEVKQLPAGEAVAEASRQLELIFETTDTPEITLAALNRFLGKDPVLTDLDLYLVVDKLPLGSKFHEAYGMYTNMHNKMEKQKLGHWNLDGDAPADVPILFRTISNVKSVRDPERLKNVMTYIGVILKASTISTRYNAQYNSSVLNMFLIEYQRILKLAK